MAEITIILNMPTSYRTETFATENSSLFFQIWNLTKKKYPMCPNKKVLHNQNKYQINQKSCSPGLVCFTRLKTRMAISQNFEIF